MSVLDWSWWEGTFDLTHIVEIRMCEYVTSSKFFTAIDVISLS